MGEMACVVNKNPVNARDFLLESEESLHRYTDWCPSAQTIEAWSETLECDVVIQLKCKRWGCRHCGQRKVASLAHKTRAANPTKLITLTVWNELFENPRQAYDRTRKLIPVLIRKIRSEIGEFEYLKVLEITKKGWPHYHMVARCGYVKQSWLSNAWAEISGAKIVDIRAIKKGQDVYWYIVKYLSKQAYIPWTNRRCSWSKNFFNKEKKLDSVKLFLRGARRSDQHPYHYIKQFKMDHYCGRFSKDLLVFSKNLQEIATIAGVTAIKLTDPVRKDEEFGEKGDYEGRFGSWFDFETGKRK